MLLKPDEIGSLGNDGIRPQLRGWQAGGDGRAQKVHRGVVGQAQQLLLHRMGPGGRRAGAGGGLLRTRRLWSMPKARLLPDSLSSGRTQERQVLFFFFKHNPLTERSESSL